MQLHLFWLLFHLFHVEDGHIVIRTKGLIEIFEELTLELRRLLFLLLLLNRSAFLSLCRISSSICIPAIVLFCYVRSFLAVFLRVFQH